MASAVASAAAVHNASGGGVLGEVDALRRSNAELARANLAKETEIEEVRRQIAIVRSTEYEPAKMAFDEKFNRQAAAREFIAPEVRRFFNFLSILFHQTSSERHFLR